MLKEARLLHREGVQDLDELVGSEVWAVLLCEGGLGCAGGHGRVEGVRLADGRGHRHTATRGERVKPLPPERDERQHAEYLGADERLRGVGHVQTLCHLCGQRTRARG